MRTVELWWGDLESLLASWILDTRSERGQREGETCTLLGVCIALCWLVSPDGPSNCLPFSPFAEAAHTLAGQISKDQGQGHSRWREPLQLRFCHTWPSSGQSVGCRMGAQGLNPPPESCGPAADLRWVFTLSHPPPSPE